jgi:hypothetical protein
MCIKGYKQVVLLQCDGSFLGDAVVTARLMVFGVPAREADSLAHPCKVPGLGPICMRKPLLSQKTTIY